jgi:hypothetical protein
MAIILKAQAERQQQLLKTQAIAESANIIAQRLHPSPDNESALQIFLALGYLDLGQQSERVTTAKSYLWIRELFPPLSMVRHSYIQ